jgi:FAD binding domain
VPGVPVLSRGGGTSLADQCTNAAVMLDWSKYCHRIESEDEQERTCIIEPGIVLDLLNENLSGRSLRFGPEPWISSGQLSTAKRVLRRTVDQLAEHVRAGGYVVGLEPSCTAVFRSDAAELSPDDQDVLRLRDHTVTVAELLTEHTPGWEPPPLTDREVPAQVHCHQHAVLGWDADAGLLESACVKAEHLNSGCCGLAGNFGFQPGHPGVSESLAEQVLLSRLRDADPGAVVLADGFSCRTQIHELDSGGREAMHLAELLAAAGASPAERPEVTAALRPSAPSRAATIIATAGILAAAAAGATAALRTARR